MDSRQMAFAPWHASKRMTLFIYFSASPHNGVRSIAL